MTGSEMESDEEVEGTYVEKLLKDSHFTVYKHRNYKYSTLQQQKCRSWTWTTLDFHLFLPKMKHWCSCTPTHPSGWDCSELFHLCKQLDPNTPGLSQVKNIKLPGYVPPSKVYIFAYTKSNNKFKICLGHVHSFTQPVVCHSMPISHQQFCAQKQGTSYASHGNNTEATNRTTQKGAEDRVWIAWEIQPCTWTSHGSILVHAHKVSWTLKDMYIYSKSLQNHTSGVPAHHFARCIQVPDEWPDGPAVPSTEKAICSKGWQIQHIWICIKA